MSYPPNTIPHNADDQQITLKKILLALTTAFPGVFAGLTDAQLRASAVTVNSKVGATVVSGIPEGDTWASRTAATYNIAAGALSWAFSPAADFVGTVNGIAWSGSSGSELFQGAVSRVAQPGNTLPAATITRSAGTYLTAEGRPT